REATAAAAAATADRIDRCGPSPFRSARDPLRTPLSQRLLGHLSAQRRRGVVCGHAAGAWLGQSAPCFASILRTVGGGGSTGDRQRHCHLLHGTPARLAGPVAARPHHRGAHLVSAADRTTTRLLRAADAV